MKKTIQTSLVPAVIMALALVSGAYAQNFVLQSSVIGGAGANMASADYALSGTLGQSVAGYASSADYGLESGFWVTGPTPVVVNGLNAAKALADDTYVQVTGEIATTDYSNFSGFFYIEDSNRTGGIRVVATSMSGTLARGMTVSLTGYMDTTSAGEREIDNAAVTVSGTPALLGPLGLTNESLGGGTLGNPAGGLGQYGVSGGSGANNIGLLVKVWGAVRVLRDRIHNHRRWFGGDCDGRYLGAPGVPTSGYVEVTGISSLYGTTGSATGLVLAID